MMNLSGEQLALIATAIVSLISAVTVAKISKKPQEKTQVDEYGFFYDQHQIFDDRAIKEAENLREKKMALENEIKKLKKQITDLEEIIKIYEKEIKEKDDDLDYWISEAKIAYKIIEKEI